MNEECLLEPITSQDACLGCRGCCRFRHKEGPWLPQLLASEKKERGHIVVVPNEEGSTPYRCTFLSTGDNKCAIYGSRPFECRLYPFVLNRHDGRYFLSVDPNCPSVSGRLEDAGFKAYAQRLARLLSGGERLEMLRDNRHMFQAYSDVRDLAELPV